MHLSLPETLVLATRERDANAPKATITVANISPEVAAEIFTYGLQVILNRAANTPENVDKALACAARLNAGQHWRTRAAGETTDSLTAECRGIAEEAVKNAKKADPKFKGMKMADFMALPQVKAKITEIMARPKTIADAQENINKRMASAAELGLSQDWLNQIDSL
jgi:hypothetical protein